MKSGDWCGRLRSKLGQLRASTGHTDLSQSIFREIDSELGELDARLSWLHREQRALSERVQKIDQSLLFRIVRWPGTKYGWFRELKNRWFPGPDSAYKNWLAHESIQPAGQLQYKPLLSIVVAAPGCSPDWLRETVESVMRQAYTTWELSVSVDPTLEPTSLAFLDQLVRSGHRVRVDRHDPTQGISHELNAACSEAGGEYIGFLNPGDVLSPYALHYVVEAMQSSHATLLYTDEDLRSADGSRMNPVFKPAWSPDLLTATMYLGNFLVVSKEAFRAVGGFRNDYDGAREFDLALRITERDDSVVHVPRILYHRRESDGDRPMAQSAGRAALADAARRRHWEAQVVDGAFPLTFQIRHAANRRVSIVICSRSPGLLKAALESVRSNTSYAPGYEIVAAEHCPVGENPEIARLAVLHGCQLVSVPGPFNFSEINNQAARRATGEVLVFLNDDVEPLTADWLTRLCSHLEREEIGVVGAKLLYPSGMIQHAGVVVGMVDGAGHVNRNKSVGEYWRWTHETRNVSAVTGACLAVRAEVFRRLGGFDAAFPNNYNDVDLCLRVRDAGYRVLYEPSAVLRHYEGQTRELVVSYDERERFYLRWHRFIDSGDPYYTPNLTLDGEDGSLNLSGGRVG